MHYYNPALAPTPEWLTLFSDPRFRRASPYENFLAGGWVPSAGNGVGARALYRLGYLPLVRRRRYRSLLDDRSQSFGVDPAFFDRRFRSVEGYFQHPGYFDAGLPTVVTSCRSALERLGQTLEPAEDAVAVHVRGGDYAVAGWALEPSYYVRAAGRLPEHVAALGFRVYGDDPARKASTCAHLVEAGLSAVVAPETTAPDGRLAVLADLAALARHRHVLMSNSTFCWWAVALGDPAFGVDDRVVVAPEPWDPDGSADLTRPTWLTEPASFEQPGGDR
jgi:hypothetical protein